MSIESATRFLNAVAQDQTLRNKFEAVNSPEEFLQISDRLGYCFTTEELKEIVEQLSQTAKVRRSTGVWRWLRSTHWV